jgi:hypothetical protein
VALTVLGGKKMTQKTRIVIALAVLLGIVLIVFAVDWLRQQNAARAQVTLPPGAVPIYLDGKLTGGFQPTDLERLRKVSFTEPAEGTVQEGWLLRDVLQLHINTGQLKASSSITVSSTTRGKSAQLTWAEVDDPANWVMFDLSNRGTLKLVSTLEKLDEREEWVQDTDRIEVQR